ncbi:MAG: HAMP domain-containing histidine kinase [Deltaproteobacteria bacterium]|nr:HAMP domain-containing histidine kinase [Deltaproteobacteria bacterium]
MIFSKGIDKLKRIGKNSGNSAPKMEEMRPDSVAIPESSDKRPKGKGHMPTGRERIKIDLLIHDLKVPLAVIEAGVVALLNKREKYGPVTERQEKVFARVLRNTKVLKTLVNDALELGRCEEGVVNFSTFTLSSLIEEALEEIFDLTDAGATEEIKRCVKLAPFRKVLENKGVHLDIEEDLWEEKICQDHGKLNQILRNLLNNALKYRKSLVELKIDRTDASIIFSVKDDGEGIPAAYHEKIFQSYFQMEPDARGACSVRGHGLGLAGVMVLVEDLGGKLFLDSDEGLGTRFLVKLPLK